MELLRLFIPWISLSFIAGCFAAYFFTPSLAVVSVAVCVVSVAALLSRNHGRILLVCVCIVALLLGFIRVLYAERHIESSLVSDNPGTVFITGKIISDIEDKETRSRYIVALSVDGESEHAIGVGGGGYPLAVVREEAAVLVYEPYPTLCVTGDSISFVGRLQEPEDFVTKNGRVFRYRQHLRQSGVYATAFVDEVSCDGTPESFVVFARLRSLFVDAMNAFLPAQEASLLGGLLLGLRGALSADMLEAFRLTGLIHIIVLSGYNITVVAEAVRRSLVRAPRFLALFFSLVTVVAFVFLAGAQTAAVRAGSMATIALIARAIHREHDGVRALLLVAAGMVLYNPDQVLFSVSFHLSFLATLGLLIFSPLIERRLSFVPEQFQIRGIVAVTIATQVFLLPYLAYSIGEVSLIGILANILVLPIIPIAMALGAAVTAVALFSATLAVVLSPFAYFPLTGIIMLASFLSQVPYAAVSLPEISAPIMVALTVLLTYLCVSALMRNRDEEEERV